MQKSIQDTKCRVLEVRPASLYTLQLFIDPAPGLFYLTERIRGEKWTEEIKRTVSKAKENPNTLVKIVRGKDFIDDGFYQRNDASLRVDTPDADELVMKRLELSYDDTYTFEQIRQMNLQ